LVISSTKERIKIKRRGGGIEDFNSIPTKELKGQSICRILWIYKNFYSFCRVRFPFESAEGESKTLIQYQQKN